MRAEYVALKGLATSEGYKVLKELWLHQLTTIESGRDKAAARGNETAWRYWAGQEKGFKIAMTALERALIDMEKQDEDLAGEQKIDAMLKEIRGEKI